MNCESESNLGYNVRLSWKEGFEEGTAMLMCFATRQGATNRSLYKAFHSLPSSQVDTCILSMAHEVLHHQYCQLSSLGMRVQP